MELSFSKSIYGKIPLLKAVYQFTDQIYFHLQQNQENWIVTWRSKEGVNLSPEVFENELIRQQLREELLKENQQLRTVLLARALASTVVEIPDTFKGEAPSFSADSVLKGWFETHDDENEI